MTMKSASSKITWSLSSICREMQGRYVMLAVMMLAFVACRNEDDEPKAQVSEQDKKFALDVSYSNLAEISMGQLAISEGNDPFVQEFGEMMVTDHTNAQDQLANLAESNDLAISDTLMTEHKFLHDQLSSLEGPAFDSAYINSQIQAHQEAQQIFQTQIDKGQHPQLVEFASITLPHINMHLERALELREELMLN